MFATLDWVIAAGPAGYGFLFLVFFTGCCFGSFLNVVIYRLPLMLERQWQAEARQIVQASHAGEESDSALPQRFNLAFPASACPKCQQPIRAWQNIPLFSYALLRGRCHHCQAGISIRYPLVELLAGVLTLVVFLKLGPGWPCLLLLALTYGCIALAGIDIDHQLLPDNITLPLLWLGLLVNAQGMVVPLEHAVYGAVAGYLSLWSVYWAFRLLTGKEGMGFGDFKLLACFGAWFGWKVLPSVIFASSAIGALVGLWLIKARGREASAPMPFGPFIIAAGWLTGLFPDTFLLYRFMGMP